MLSCLVWNIINRKADFFEYVNKSQWYQEHKDEVKQRARDYYYSHKIDRLEYIKKYQKDNASKHNEWNNTWRQRVRAKLLHVLGDVCSVCGSTERIELDHKLAGGNHDRMIKGDNHGMYRYYLNHPEEAKEKLQLLCKTHNLRKEHLNHERHPSM